MAQRMAGPTGGSWAEWMADWKAEQMALMKAGMLAEKLAA